MRWVWIVLGAVLFLLGLLWTLQGLNVITGSAMSGQKVWFAIGLLLIIGGVASLYSGVRRSATVQK